jgi:raffinose/stachyose/melibiose transport system permease protein
MTTIDAAGPGFEMPRIAKRPVRWHIAVFLAPALLVYTAVMILPLIGTLRLSLFRSRQPGRFRRLRQFPVPCSAMTVGRSSFWNALKNNHVVLHHPHAGAEPDRHRARRLLSLPVLRLFAPSTARRSSCRRSCPSSSSASPGS